MSRSVYKAWRYFLLLSFRHVQLKNRGLFLSLSSRRVRRRRRRRWPRWDCRRTNNSRLARSRCGPRLFVETLRPLFLLLSRFLLSVPSPTRYGQFVFRRIYLSLSILSESRGAKSRFERDTREKGAIVAAAQNRISIVDGGIASSTIVRSTIARLR